MIPPIGHSGKEKLWTQGMDLCLLRFSEDEQAFF